MENTVSIGEVKFQAHAPKVEVSAHSVRISDDGAGDFVVEVDGQKIQDIYSLTLTRSWIDAIPWTLDLSLNVQHAGAKA